MTKKKKKVIATAVGVGVVATGVLLSPTQERLTKERAEYGGYTKAQYLKHAMASGPMGGSRPPSRPRPPKIVATANVGMRPH